MLKRLPDRDVDPTLRAILKQACIATEALEIPFFVGGAMARDITFVHVFGQEVKRATRDVDLGIYLDGWERFEQLKNVLIGTGMFHAVDGKPHRLHYERQNGVPLDLIPFGQIEHPAGEIAWPPGNDVVLNVAGFEDAFHSALTVDLGQELVRRAPFLLWLCSSSLHGVIEGSFLTKTQQICCLSRSTTPLPTTWTDSTSKSRS